MKKIAFFLLIIVSCLSVAAQEHMKFMGIPLTGNIETFTSKLKAKGCTISAMNSAAPVGVRVLNGTFSGEEATICVYYNATSKNVYGAKAYMEYYGKARAIEKQSHYENLLDTKYPDALKDVSTEEDDYGHSFRVIQYLVRVGEDNFGAIYLQIMTSSYSDTGEYTLHLQYEDGANSLNNTKSQLDDL